MAIDRTGISLTDDSGDGTSGTLIDRAWFEHVLDHIDSLIGEWTAVTTAAGNFSANGSMTWTVEDGDIESFAYVKHNKTLTVEWCLSGTVVGGSANTQLLIKIPGGYTANRITRTTSRYYDGTNWKTGEVRVAAGGTTIALLTESTGNWPTTATAMVGEVTFEVQ